jgi:hypothetical protein
MHDFGVKHWYLILVRIASCLVFGRSVVSCMWWLWNYVRKSGVCVFYSVHKIMPSGRIVFTWWWLNEPKHVVRNDECMVCPYYLLLWENKIKKFYAQYWTALRPSLYIRVRLPKTGESGSMSQALVSFLSRMLSETSLGFHVSEEGRYSTIQNRPNNVTNI